MENPVMYIVANKGLDMSPGKLAAQVAHAAVRGVMKTPTGIIDDWLQRGETKIVLEARDTEHMIVSENYLASKGFSMAVVIDEGRTEVPPHSMTAMASIVVDKNDEIVRQAFGDFRTYRSSDPAATYREGLHEGMADGLLRARTASAWQRLTKRF